MFSYETIVDVLNENPASEVEVELEAFENSSVDYTDVAKATGRNFRMIEAVTPSEDGGLALYVRRIVFEPNVGGAI
ncbi:hypothetical protein [Salipiger sp.]|uniref:hypothetical protein n=1 Tax=Salipiger sp. TaxID=2078585 RepID=UPI003A985625